VFADRSRQTFHFELVLKGHSRGSDEVLMSCSRHLLNSAGPGLDTRRTFTVEFSKTGAPRFDSVKKPPTRARGQPSRRFVSDTSRAGWLLASSYRDLRTPTSRTAEGV